MNVVFAGIDMALAQLREGNLSHMQQQRLLELLEDVSGASETAILILNELLQYENIDAGDSSSTFPTHFLHNSLHT
jgi:hypothetical protein